jgi:hypothetical protein
MTEMRLAPHITEEDVATITRMILPTIAADAWDAGYRAGSLDGYFGTREEKNPYRKDS